MEHPHRLLPTPRLATPISASTLHLRTHFRLPRTAEELDPETVVLERKPSSRPSILPSAPASSISSAFRPESDQETSPYTTARESPALTSSKATSSIDPATSSPYGATPPHIHIPPRRSRPGFPNYENSWWPYFYADKGANSANANSEVSGPAPIPAFHSPPYGSDGTSHSEFMGSTAGPSIPPLAADGHVVGEVMRSRKSRGFNRQVEMAQVDGAGSSETRLMAEYEVRPVGGNVGTAVLVDSTLSEKEKKARRRWFSMTQRVHDHERKLRKRAKLWKEVKTVGRVTAVCFISVVTCCGGCSCFRPDRAG